MANHTDVNKILSRLLEKSETNKDKHQAIALVGDWGIGKTFLWKDFYNNKKSSLSYDKYAYVSLFGISSLEELKLKIATEIISTKSDKRLKQDAMPFIKKSLKSILPNRLSHSGISLGISSSVVSSLIIASLKDTIVCLDDLERCSKNLPIDEVMGLVNYLTQERDCSVVCLLNRDEIKDEQYKNYKEKVFTHELSIDDSLDAILNKIPENDHKIVEKFYLVFAIKNIRFYEKVIELYSSFIHSLNNETLSNTSKNTILSSFLLLTAFDRMPKVMGIGLDDFIHNFSEENYMKHLLYLDGDKSLPTEKELSKKIGKFARSFTIDKWQLAILEFMNSYKVDENINEAIDKDLFEETILANKRQLDVVQNEYYNLDLQPNFSSRLAEAVHKNIKTEHYNMISHWCNVLEGMGETAKSNEIVTRVKKQIDQQIKEYSGIDYLGDVYPMRERDTTDDKFYDYIETELSKSFHPSKEHIIQFFIASRQKEQLNISSDFLKNMSKEELKAVIWADLNQLEYDSRRSFIKSVITYCSLDNNQKEQFRQWAVEILREKADASNSEQKYVIDTFLKDSNDLRT